MLAFLSLTVVVGLFVYSRLRAMPLPNAIDTQPAPVAIQPEATPLAKWQAETKAIPITIRSLRGDELTYQISNQRETRTATLSPNIEVFERAISLDFTYTDTVASRSAIQTNRPAFMVLSGSTVEAIYLIAN